MTQDLPLFEIDLVALPGEVLPLHIFEPRYQEMIKACIAVPDRRRQGFVIALKQKNLASVGTFVRIIQMVEEYEDGRSVIVVQGKERVNLIKRKLDGSYPKVSIHPFEDRKDSRDCEDLYAQVLVSIKLIVNLLGTDDDLEVLSDPCSAFVVAALLGLENSEKQQLITLPSEASRLEFLSGLLQFRIAEVQSKMAHDGQESQMKIVH